MKPVAALALLGILSVLPAFGQATQTDSQTLQAILVEIRELHNDVRLSQTTQILLAEMQMQQTVVTRALEKRDSVKSSLEQVQNQQKGTAATIAQIEERANATIDPAEKKRIQEAEEQIKSQMTNLKNMEQQRSNDLADAESRLTKEQDALSSIQDQLNAVVKKLQPAASQ
jgi:DNA repair exonuclease SbcCD ATPase subunit